MRKSIPIVIMVATIATILACRKEPSTTTPTTGTLTLDLPETPYDYYPATASGNNNKATLGRVLFYDKHLSINNSVACASCHKQEMGFADNVAFSRGFENKVTGRNSMPIVNLPSSSSIGFGGITNLFWDGRIPTVPDLVIRPITNHVEMGISDIEALPTKLQDLPYYGKLFENAYGTSEITLEKISESMAAFIEAIRADSCRFELQKFGKATLNAQEQLGLTLFDSKYNCRSCHTLTGTIYYGETSFVDIGLDDASTDIGRGAISNNPADNGKFRVPTLHNIALTAPYMHDGRLATLEQVIDHYSTNIHNSPNLDPRLKDASGAPLKMNISDDEKKALIAFLNTLTDHKMISDPKFSNPFKLK